MILDIEQWQKPDTVPITEQEQVRKLPVERSDEVLIIKQWICPEHRAGVFLNTYDRSLPSENTLYEMEQIVKKWHGSTALQRLELIEEYRNHATFYNNLCGFEAMITDLLQVNKPLTNKPAQIVVNIPL